MLKKKSLGQHFLRDPRILQKIADAAKLASTDTVLEVGPGEGTLTVLLLQKAEKVIAVEKDARLIPLLQRNFAAEIASGKLELVPADILDFDTNRYTLNATRWKIVANLPYYITGQFLRRSLQAEQQPSSMTLLLQKEVAKRILAAPHSAQGSAGQGRESILSISVKAYGSPRYVATVKAGSFSPPPKVDSAILTIESISRGFFSDAQTEPSAVTRLSLVRKREEKFFALLKKGFAHPRKLLSSNLGVAPHALEQCGIPQKSRAENLSLADWKTLAQQVQIYE